MVLLKIDLETKLVMFTGSVTKPQILSIYEEELDFSKLEFPSKEEKVTD